MIKMEDNILMSNKPFLLDEEYLSSWAYDYCYIIEDDPEIRKCITESFWAYKYCRDIKDRPEVRKYITESEWAYKYCMNLKNDPKVKKYI